MDRKKIRAKIGYTAEAQNQKPSTWLWLARGFHNAAEVLHVNADRVTGNSKPFALNAGYSLELLFKCLIAEKGVAIPDDASGHNLGSLSEKAGVQLSKDQLITLEQFTETIVWLGRYPGPKGPKKEAKWDHYQDVLRPKVELRGTMMHEGKSATFVKANPATFSNWENYNSIWDAAIKLVTTVSN